MSAIKILNELIETFEQFNHVDKQSLHQNDIINNKNCLSWNNTVLKDEISTPLSSKDIKQLLITRGENNKKALQLLKCKKKIDLIKYLKSKYTLDIRHYKYKNLSKKQLICELKVRGICNRNQIAKNTKKSKLIDLLNANFIGKDIIESLKFLDIFGNKISCSHCPKQQLIEHWYYKQSITDIVTLLRSNEANCLMISSLCNKLNILWHHFPISGAKKITSSVNKHFINCNQNNDIISLTNCVSNIIDIIKNQQNRNIVIHCAAGQHRTGLTMYLILRGLGFNKDNSLKEINNIRPITYTEMEKNRNTKTKYRKKKKSFFNDKTINTLTEFAEAFFKYQNK